MAVYGSGGAPELAEEGYYETRNDIRLGDRTNFEGSPGIGKMSGVPVASQRAICIKMGQG